MRVSWSASLWASGKICGLTALLWAQAAWAAPGIGGRWPLEARALTYDEALLPVRVASDLLVLPFELGRLDERSVATLLLYTYTAVALMVPDSASLDARMQQRLNQARGPNRFRVWTNLGDPLIWTTISAGVAGQWLYGFFDHQSWRMQMASLMVEALSVAQLYHVMLKLLSGRDGPNNGGGLGRINGPTSRVIKQWPAGTPSGHAATAYALLGVAVSFIEQPWVRVGLHFAAMAFAVSLVMDNYHFASDVLIGSAMGYGIGRWVASHRSTAGLARWYDDVTVIPYTDPLRQGAGVVFLFHSPI